MILQTSLDAKAREAQQQYVPEWSYSLLKDGQKFAQLLDCLNTINSLLETEKGFTSAKEFAISLKSVFEFCRAAGRLIARNSRDLASSILYSEVVAYREFLKGTDTNKFEEYGEILCACQSVQEVHECCRAMEQITRNTKLSQELSDQGVLPSRLTEIGSDTFKEAAEAIRMSKPLGCLLDKQVRSAKGLWKNCRRLETKRPELKKLAKIYIQCAEYIDRINKENELTNLALQLKILD